MRAFYISYLDFFSFLQYLCLSYFFFSFTVRQQRFHLKDIFIIFRLLNFKMEKIKEKMKKIWICFVLLTRNEKKNLLRIFRSAICLYLQANWKSFHYKMRVGTWEVISLFPSCIHSVSIIVYDHIWHLNLYLT